MKRLSLLAAGAVLLLVGTGCPPGDPVPVTTGAQKPDIGPIDAMGGEQAEVAFANGGVFILNTVVAGFNDFSIDPHFIYAPSNADPQSRQVTRGVSLMGWSISYDAGQTFTYNGKVKPPQGWSAIWGDPSIAVDPTAKNVVYYAQIAASDPAWNAVTGGQEVTDLSPGRDMVDGVCIARSTDGGGSFPEVACIPLGTFPASVDRTAVTVDGQGHLYVATNSRQNNIITGSIVMRSGANWNQFAPLPPAPFGGDGEPWIVTDPNGDVWYSVRTGNDVGLQRWRQNAVAWDDSGTLGSLCGTVLGQRDPTYAGGRQLRNAHSYSLAVGRDDNRQFSIRAALQLARPDTSTYIKFVEVLGSKCFSSDGWSTEGAGGQQMEPTISFRDSAPFPTWYAVYLTSETVPDPNQAYVWPKGVAIVGLPVGNTVLRYLARPTALAQNNTYACTRLETGQPDYYGDYMGLTQAADSNGRLWAIAGFSDSRPSPPCTFQASFLANPLHVGSGRW